MVNQFLPKVFDSQDQRLCGPGSGTRQEMKFPYHAAQCFIEQICVLFNNRKSSIVFVSCSSSILMVQNTVGSSTLLPVMLASDSPLKRAYRSICCS